MKPVASTLVVAIILTLPPLVHSQAPGAASEKTSIWMRQKLRASQEILKGLSDGDFQSIGANAQSMNVMEHLERWARAKRPDYQTQLRLFEFANRELIRSASERNLDGATLAYTQLTVSCVNCHKIVRKSRK